MQVTILGNGGAIPANGRFPTSQFVDMGTECLLIDCGEGAQIKMQEYGIKSNRINHVFISHLHGDHFFGLIGWLNTQALLGRTKDLNLYANEKLEAILAIQMDYPLPFTVHFKALPPNESMVCVQTDKCEVIAFPVWHSIPTHGFRCTIKRNKRIMNSEKVRELEVPNYFYKKLTEGLDYIKPNGDVIPNEMVTLAGKPNLIYSYCADTGFTDAYLAFIHTSNLIYHEATYCAQQIDKATQRHHCTAMQAATIAKQANAKQLIIGHFSSQYKTTDLHLAEAKTIFADVQIAEQGMVFTVQ
jgi:ribonuclease Z